MNNSISIMQGRLLPPFEERFQAFPTNDWQAEFQKAAQLGLYSIEWIYEKPYESENPLGTDEGIQKIKRLARETEVGVFSVCADYYMTEPLISDGLRVEKNWEHLKWLCRQASKLDITYIVLPFVDASSLQSTRDQESLAIHLIDFLSHHCHSGVELHLETDLPPVQFAALLKKINHPAVKINYDIGNSSSLRYDPDEEFSLFGSYLGSVHIKDRILNGRTVELGKGNADFNKCFTWFKKLDFQRWFVLQTARGQPGNEFENIKNHIDFTTRYINNAA